MALNVHSYEPLRNPNDIRVLALHPSTNQIRCTLAIVSLDDNPQYEALSYVWGDPVPSHRILVDNDEFAVTDNLYEALRHFTPADSLPRYLWIDAICLNRNDTAERGAQVLLMGRIYQQASRVLAWLGTRRDDSDLAMDLISESHDWADSEFGIIEAQSALRAVGPLAARPWWHRIWCMQEIAIPRRDPLLVCGAREVPFSRVQQFSERLGRIQIGDNAVLNSTLLAVLENMALFAGVRRILQIATKGLGLNLLLRYAWSLHSAEPRDHVYALLGLAGDHVRQALAPDYGAAVPRVYADATRCLLLEDRSLRFLSIESDRLGPRRGGGGSSSSSSSLHPSWVPDWSFVAKSDKKARHGLLFDVYRATDECPAGTYPSDWNTLRVDGILLDPLEHVTEPLHFDDICKARTSLDLLEAIFHGLQQKKSAAVGSRSSAAARVLSMDPQVSDAVWRTLVADCQMLFDGKASHPAPAEWAELFEVLLHGQREEAPRRWWHAGGVLKLPSRRRSRRPDIPNNFRPDMAASDRLSKYLHPLINRLNDWDDCQFFVTQSGRIGVTPHGRARVGDVVALLMGSNVPFILRPGEPQQPYEFVSDAYVHGIMKGEALAETDINGIRPKVGIIELR